MSVKHIVMSSCMELGSNLGDLIFERECSKNSIKLEALYTIKENDIMSQKIDSLLLEFYSELVRKLESLEKIS